MMYTGPLAWTKTVMIAKSFGQCQPALTAQAYISRYLLQMHQVTFSKRVAKTTVATLFVAFVEDNATMSSTRYFENQVSYFVH